MSEVDGVRRVVMGAAAWEHAVSTRVEEIEPIVSSGLRVWFIAGWDGERRVPHLEEEAYAPRSWFPPSPGVRVLALEFFSSHESDEGEQTGELFDRLMKAEPAGQWWDESLEGMHRSNTIDFGVVVAGEVEIEAGDGTSEILRPGDVYVQYGALHRWKPAAGSPSALVVFVCLGAEPAAPEGAPQQPPTE